MCSATDQRTTTQWAPHLPLPSLTNVSSFISLERNLLLQEDLMQRHPLTLMLRADQFESVLRLGSQWKRHLL